MKEMTWIIKGNILVQFFKKKFCHKLVKKKIFIFSMLKAFVLKHFKQSEIAANFVPKL